MHYTYSLHSGVLNVTIGGAVVNKQNSSYIAPINLRRVRPRVLWPPSRGLLATICGRRSHCRPFWRLSRW